MNLDMYPEPRQISPGSLGKEHSEGSQLTLGNMGLIRCSIPKYRSQGIENAVKDLYQYLGVEMFSLKTGYCTAEENNTEEQSSSHKRERVTDIVTQ
jgi:hypothetical protein